MVSAKHDEENWSPPLVSTKNGSKNDEENAHNGLGANWKHPDEYPEDGMVKWHTLIICILWTLQVVPEWHLGGAS